MSWAWGRIFGEGWPKAEPTDPDTRCVDGIPPQFWTCHGQETKAPEPYLLKVLGDRTPVIMCQTHRENSQRDADEATITFNDIRFPRYDDD